MLSYFPCKVCRNSNTDETVVFYFYMGLCSNTILKAGSEPGVDVARNIYSSCAYEIVPVIESQCQGQTRMDMKGLPRCQGIVAVPKESKHEYDYSKEVRRLEEFISQQLSSSHISQ